MSQSCYLEAPSAVRRSRGVCGSCSLPSRSPLPPAGYRRRCAVLPRATGPDPLPLLSPGQLDSLRDCRRRDSSGSPLPPPPPMDTLDGPTRGRRASRGQSGVTTLTRRRASASSLSLVSRVGRVPSLTEVSGGGTRGGGTQCGREHHWKQTKTDRRDARAWQLTGVT